MYESIWIIHIAVFVGNVNELILKNILIAVLYTFFEKNMNYALKVYV